MAIAPKVCPEHGCPRLMPCPQHRKIPWKGAKRTGMRQLSGYREQQRNALVLRLHHGICHVCGKAGADEVDHVIPRSEDGPDLLSNLRPIHSLPCHRAKTQEEARRGKQRRSLA